MHTDLGALLITGGARGIGAATARLAAMQGYQVAINYRQQANTAQRLVEELTAGGHSAIAIQGDVAQAADVERMFAIVDREIGPLKALVNSAGIAGNEGPVGDFSSAVLERLFSVNVIGTMLCCREAIRRMSTQHGATGGAIVNVSSMSGTIGGRAGASDYAASKAAVDSFTKGVAKEVAAEGIRVNAVRPGMTVTDMTSKCLEDPAVQADIAATIPCGRAATAEEIAHPIVWLLSAEASFISGACVDASGGGFVVGRSL